MLALIVDERWFAPKAVVGCRPSGTAGNDIRPFTDETRQAKLATLSALRQQLGKLGDWRPNLALAASAAPVDSGKQANCE